MNISQTLADAVRKHQDRVTDDLHAAGHLPANRGLQLAGTVLQTSDTTGAPAELSPAAQAFINAYVPPPDPTPPDFGTDLATPDQLREQAAGIVSNLTAFIDAPTPTNAQVVAAVKLNARINRYVLRRALA